MWKHPTNLSLSLIRGVVSSECGCPPSLLIAGNHLHWISATKKDSELTSLFFTCTILPLEILICAFGGQPPSQAHGHQVCVAPPDCRRGHVAHLSTSDLRTVMTCGMCHCPLRLTSSSQITFSISPGRKEKLIDASICIQRWLRTCLRPCSDHYWMFGEHVNLINSIETRMEDSLASHCRLTRCAFWEERGRGVTSWPLPLTAPRPFPLPAHTE